MRRTGWRGDSDGKRETGNGKWEIGARAARNAQRLTMLGFVPLLAALAHLMAVNRVELPGTLQFWTIFGTAAFVTSLHHAIPSSGRTTPP